MDKENDQNNIQNTPSGHLNSEAIFSIANDLDVSSSVLLHLEGCSDCLLLVEKEKAFSQVMTQSLRVESKIDVSEKVFAQLNSKAQAKILFSGETLYFSILVGIMAIYFCLISVNGAHQVFIPKIPYFLSIFTAIGVLTGLTAYFNYRKWNRDRSSTSAK